MSRSLVLSVICLAAMSLALSGCGAKQRTQAEPATLPPASDLYQRLGGEEAIRAVIADYVAITSQNPRVNFTRKGTPAEWNPTPENVATLTDRLVQFVSLVTGDVNASYQGRNMVESHRNMHITHAEFDATLDDLRQAMAKNNVPEDLQREVVQLVDRLTRDAIVEVAQ